VRSFVTEEAEIQNYSEKINVSYFVAKKRAWIAGALGAVSSMASDACILLALWYGGQMIFAGVITTGDLISYMLFALQSVFAFQALLSIFPRFMEAIGASVRVFELLDRVPKVNYDGGVIPPQGIEGRVSFQDVRFRYPSRPEAAVLDGVAFDVVPGKSLAIVGPSGGGKSTAIALISRFYDVDTGAVLIGRGGGGCGGFVGRCCCPPSCGAHSPPPLQMASTSAATTRSGCAGKLGSCRRSRSSSPRRSKEVIPPLVGCTSDSL
jgi:ABC-type multidrug transport system fused ATPase/permease subunit